MNEIKDKYSSLLKGGRMGESIDIFEHLPTLYSYAKNCNSVFETGVRGCVSSWAFLYGLADNNNSDTPKNLFLNDINECDINHLLTTANKLDNVSVKYEWKNNLHLEFEENEKYDITFIDTWHVYGQLKRELEKFSKITNKYIIMHDTTVDEFYGETIRSNWDPVEQSNTSGFPVEEITKGLWPAIEEFLIKNEDWYVKVRFTNNNGLTVLAKYE
jgi:hypothetical protein